MAAPAQTTPDALDPSAPADPIALAAFVSRRGGRVVAYLDAVTTPDRALHAAGEAFASFRQSRAADPEGEAAATALLGAVRRAATANAENPYRPDGRERPARRTRACEAMPRLLVAWTEGRLPDGDVARLIEHLQECPDCRALRDAFDRAEIGYRAGESVDLDGTEVGVIATAMALASPAAPSTVAARTALPTAAPTVDRPRRTAIPAPPSSLADHLAKPSAPAPVGRRTAIPAPPTSVPEPPTARTSRPTSVPEPPTAVPAAPSAKDRGDEEPARPRRRPVTGAPPQAPEDPLGPEALGYAVPGRGLPRPARRPAVPRVKRRRQRRPASAAVEAAAAAVVRDAPEAVDATLPVEAPTATSAASTSATSLPREVVVTTDDRAAETPAPGPEGPSATSPTPSLAASTTLTPAEVEQDTDGAVPSDAEDPADQGDRPVVAVAPATIDGSAAGGRARITTVGRRALQVPIVRQLGVPAVLLLAVLIAALIAAGAFAGQDTDSVEPVTRPSIPTVPSNAGEIPPLR